MSVNAVKNNNWGSLAEALILSMRYGLTDEDTRNGLQDHFEQKQLDLIECAFERDDIYGGGNRHKQVAEAVVFGEQFKKDDERLIAIMKNIIKNKGKFKAPKISNKVYQEEYSGCC